MFNWISVGSAGTPKPCLSAPEASEPGVAFRPLLRFKGSSRWYSWIQPKKKSRFHLTSCWVFYEIILWRQVVTGTTGNIRWQCMFRCNTRNKICLIARTTLLEFCFWLLNPRQQRVCKKPFVKKKVKNFVQKSFAKQKKDCWNTKLWQVIVLLRTAFWETEMVLSDIGELNWKKKYIYIIFIITYIKNYYITTLLYII